MTAPLEIPPRAIAAAVERWSVLSNATDDEIAAVLEENDWASYVAGQMLRAAIEEGDPFSLFAERLTSDEAVEAACLVDASHSLGIEDDEAVEAYGDSNRERLEAVAAALVPSREGGR